MNRKPIKPATPYTIDGLMGAADNYATKCAGTLDLPLPANARKARAALREYAANLIAHARENAEAETADLTHRCEVQAQVITDARAVLNEYMPGMDVAPLADSVRTVIRAAVAGQIDPERLPDDVRDTMRPTVDQEAADLLRVLIIPAMLGSSDQRGPGRERTRDAIDKAIAYTDKAER